MIPTKFVFFSMIVLVTGLLGCADDSLVKDKPDTQTEQKPLVKPDVPNTTSIQQKQNPQSGLVTEKPTSEQKPLVTPDVPNTTNIQQKQNPQSGLVTEKLTSEQKLLVKPDVPNTTSIQQKQNPPSGLVTEKSTTEQRTMFQIGSDTNTPTKVLGKTVESSDDRGIKKYSAPSNYDKEVVDLLRILIPQN
ncbi:MAG: hypothetical protein QX190_10380 [Methylococcales bacterium]